MTDRAWWEEGCYCDEGKCTCGTPEVDTPSLKDRLLAVESDLEMVPLAYHIIAEAEKKQETDGNSEA